MTSGDELKGFRNLYEFSRLLLEGDDPAMLLDRLVKAIRTIADADEVILFEIEEGEARAQVFCCDRPEAALGDGVPSYSRSLVDEVIDGGQPTLLEDVCDDPRFEQANSIQELKISSAMGTPLFDDGELTGVIYAARQRLAENFNEEHLELMTVAASQASLLISRLASSRALGESESRYRSLVEMSPSTIAVVQHGVMVFANQTACRLWDGESADEFVGVDIHALFDPWRSEDLWEALRRGDAFDSIEAWITKCDGQIGVPVEVMGRPIPFGGREAMQLMIFDVAHRQEMLARRVRTDQLVTLGTMAATVAHEINNPLSYVYANLEYVTEELQLMGEREEGDEADGRVRRELMEGISSALEGTERIRAVIASIQNFRSLDDGADCFTIVEQPLESSLRIARNKLGPEVDLQVDIRPTEPVPVGAAPLGQVFLNILINAAQALDKSEDPGPPPEEDKRLEVRARQDEDRVVVEIADTGPGIAPSIEKYVFEPFVSTKDAGEGTGLGLAICHDIVEAAGGDIEVENQPGRGCLFRIVFPTVDEVPTRSMEAVPEGGQRHSGRILVVEPDRALATSLERLLQKQHDVATASTRGEAVELLGENPSFDVVLCDLRTRGGLGRDLFRWIRQQAPQYWDRLVAMIPGHSESQAREYLDDLPNQCIAKPFDIDRLRATINAMLAKEAKEANAG